MNEPIDQDDDRRGWPEEEDVQKNNSPTKWSHEKQPIDQAKKESDAQVLVDLANSNSQLSKELRETKEKLKQERNKVIDECYDIVLRMPKNILTEILSLKDKKQRS